MHVPTAATFGANEGSHRLPVGSLVRTDIQGLRAIAVSLVLTYHLWPNRLTGGFTGVDVFFAISGFLITSHLLAHPPSTVRDLATFWARRIQRLLPASLLVLLTTVIASRLVAPETQWANTANQAKAAAIYVVNWVLASDSVDYLAAEQAASPVQHFWSLSVEEQFYFIWPVLILVLVGVAVRQRRSPTLTLTVGLGAVVAASFAYSVQQTASAPASAYFVTTTRIWELGVGGLLALATTRWGQGQSRDLSQVLLPDGARAALAWTGLAAIAWTAFTYTESTPFPGWQAAVPILGTVAVIAALAPERPGSPNHLLALWPMQRLGDISYSVYLWHWPIIVLLPYVSGGHLGLLDKLAILVASGVLAALTKRYVEDPFRTSAWRRPLRKPYVLAVAAMAVVICASFAQGAEVDHRLNLAQQELRQALSDQGPCFGAAALAAPKGICAQTRSGKLTPTPSQAAQDKSEAYASVSGREECFSYAPSFPIKQCNFGREDASISVALVGNSHAGQWLPTVQQVAGQRGWRITTFLASRCALADVQQTFDTAEMSNACRRWVAQTTRRLTSGGFDLVVMSNRMSVTTQGQTRISNAQYYQNGYTTVLRAFERANLAVVGIRDTPLPGGSIPDCLATHPDDYPACDGTRRDWLPLEPLEKAVAQIGNANIVIADMTDEICPSETCPAVIGQVPVYFDGSHLSATYSRTLAPYLEKILLKAMRAS